MRLRIAAVAGIVGYSALAGSAFGQNLLDANPSSPTFNNPSFERPDITAVAPSVDVWVASGPRLDVGFPAPIIAGVGVFENPSAPDPNRLEGMDGTQAAYLFANSFADVSGGPPLDHALTQVTQLNFLAGQQYQLTVAVANASSPPPAESILTLSLFAVDAAAPGGEIPLASTAIQNNGTTPLNGESFTDFSATTAAIAGDAVGKPIGIRIQTHRDGDVVSLNGQFDVDNVRLTVVPEPAGLALAAGAGVLLAARRRRR